MGNASDIRTNLELGHPKWLPPVIEKLQCYRVPEMEWNATYDVVAGVTMVTNDVTTMYQIPTGSLEELHHKIECVTELYVKTVLYAVGIPGNLLAFFLWIQPRLRNSSACYFAALSISDTVVLVLHLLLTLEKVGVTEIFVTRFLCEIFNVLYISSETLSGMLVLGLTVDRFIIVCHPMKRHRFCTIGRTLRILLCLTLFSLTLGIIEGAFWTYSVTKHRCVAQKFITIGGSNLIMEIGNLTILIIGVILPAILVLVFNIIIIAAVVKTNRRRRTLCHTSRHVTIDIDATIMILFVSCYLILAEVPDEIAYLIAPFYPEGDRVLSAEQRQIDPTWKSHYRFSITSCIFSTFSITNYAMDIFIYSLTGRKFRQLVLILLRCHVFRKDKRKLFLKDNDSIGFSYKSPIRNSRDTRNSPRSINEVSTSDVMHDHVMPESYV